MAERHFLALPSIPLGEPSVSYYRLYFMDAFTGHIERFEDFEAERDEEAVGRALDSEGVRPLELWNENRKVARIEPVSLSSQLLERRRKLAPSTAAKAARSKLSLVQADNPKSASAS